MKKRKGRSFDRDFDASKDITTCYINYRNEETRVMLNRKDKTITLSFSFNGVNYRSDTINMERDGNLIIIRESQIKFHGIEELHQIDIKNLIDCIEKMFEYKYDLSD